MTRSLSSKRKFEEDPMDDHAVTRYFTFGFDHIHRVDGFTYDTDVVVKITAPDPRSVMLSRFGRGWAFEYREGELDLSLHPRGVTELEA